MLTVDVLAQMVDRVQVAPCEMKWNRTMRRLRREMLETKACQVAQEDVVGMDAMEDPDVLVSLAPSAMSVRAARGGRVSHVSRASTEDITDITEGVGRTVRTAKMGRPGTEGS